MQRDVYEREVSAAARYLQIALDPTTDVREAAGLLRLARNRLNSCLSEIRDTGLGPAASS